VGVVAVDPASPTRTNRPAASKAVSWTLIVFGVWSWVIWPVFIKNISADPRSWTAAGAPTAFFLVHLVLTIVSLIFGVVLPVIGIVALVKARRAARS
jgi:hypothetical protein